MIAGEEDARAWLARLPEYDSTAEQRLIRLVELLEAENRRQNLVSAGSLAEVWRRHVADSAQLLRHVPRETGPWLDLGTGAGFPGLVIAILRPETSVLLVESRKRRAEWLSHVVSELALENAQIAGARLEKVPTRAMAVISARAFAPLEKLLDQAARFSTRETVWLLPKGRSARQELLSLHDGWEHVFHVEPSITDPDAGVIVGHLAGRKGKRA